MQEDRITQQDSIPPARVELLPYEQQIIGEWVEQDALVILGSGLGWQRLLAVLLRLHHHQRNGALLILGSAAWQRQVLMAELARHDNAVPPPVDVNNEVPALDRIELYNSQAALCITPRILVVDLLSHRVKPNQIAGIFIMSAHRVTDTSGEAFAVRLFRAGNSSGWVRALTDTPAAVAGGFNKVEKIMRALHVRKLSLWPRFRNEVASAMTLGTPEVVEWEQELPHSMRLIQAAIMEVMDSLLKDLKRTHKVDTSGLTTDLASSKNIAESLRRQLEPIWNTIGWRTRQIIKDLKTLRDIGHHLITYDAVTFLAYLESLRLSAGPRTVWLFHDAAHTIYDQARRRVYLYRSPDASAIFKDKTDKDTQAGQEQKGAAKKVMSEPTSPAGSKAGGRKRKGAPPVAGSQDATTAAATGAAASNGDGRLQPVLEEVPKWELLRKVLTEVQAHRQLLQAAQPGQPHPCPQKPTTLEDLSSEQPALKEEQTTTVEAQGKNNTVSQPAVHSSGRQGDNKQSTVPSAASSRQRDVVVLDLTSSDEEDMKPQRQQARSAAMGTMQPQHAQQQQQQRPEVIPIDDEDDISHDQLPQSASDQILEPQQGGGQGDGHTNEVEILDEQGALSCQELGQAPVLVVSRELHSCSQLHGVLQQGGKAVMQAAYEAYLLRTEASKQGGKQRGRSAAGGDADQEGRRGRGRGRGGRGFGPHDIQDLGRSPVLKPGEASALAAEAERIAISRGVTVLQKRSRAGKGRSQDQKESIGAGKGNDDVARLDNKSNQNQQGDLGQFPNAEPAAATATGQQAETTTSAKPKKPRTKRAKTSGGVVADSGNALIDIDNPPSTSGTTKLNSNDDDVTPQAATAASHDVQACAPATSEDCPLLQGVHFHSSDEHCEQQLWQLKPGTIIMYDPDLAFLRQVEVYAAASQRQGLQIHLLTYADSAEQAAFLSTVDREVNVFTQLVEFKQHIVIPVGPAPAAPTQLLPRGAAALEADAWLDVYQQNAITRMGGRAGAGKAAPRQLVVDMREFMSSLPAVLHSQGFDLMPVTLEVGDYVLSPTMCVERKAVPDLISSLASGRLYSQAEAMCKHYKSPVLLIEFDNDKTFGLQSTTELGDDIDAKAVGSRLALLLIHFPRLRLIWSRSLHATADMFASLKSNQDEPDVAVAQAAGLPPEAQAPGALPIDAQINTSAVEVLKRLPGVTYTNARLIMTRVNCLADLASISLPELEAIMCSQRNARLLHDFLHAPCPRP